MVAWANRVYLWVCENTPEFGFLRDGLGLEGFFASTCETCGLADLVHLALLLAEAGVGDYWDDIERIARNQLLENQYRDAATIRHLYPGIDDRVLDMMCGGFECAAYPNRLLTWVGVEGCCIGGGLRALYLAWRGSIRDDADETYIHTAFSRITPFIQVIGHEPWQGRMDVRAYAPRRVHLRVPGYAALDQVQTLIDDQAVTVTWNGRYVTFELAAGQIATRLYSLPESSRTYTIADQTYQGRWRGNTMLEIQPAGEGYPIYQRQALLNEDALCAPDLPWLQDGLAALPFLW